MCHLSLQAHGGRRALQQEEKESEEICGKQCVTVVRSDNAFETAVKAGASFIEIRAHLNLTELGKTLEIKSSTKAIRVRTCWSDRHGLIVDSSTEFSCGTYWVY